MIAQAETELAQVMSPLHEEQYLHEFFQWFKKYILEKLPTTALRKGFYTFGLIDDIYNALFVTDTDDVRARSRALIIPNAQQGLQTRISRVLTNSRVSIAVTEIASELKVQSII